MRIIKLTGTILGLSALGALSGTACFDIAADDVLMGRICEDGSLDCFASTTTTGPQCEGDPTKDGSLVNDNCGVFVKPGATAGDGTSASPFGTFAEAAKSSSAWVFACEGDYAETEAVVFGGDVAVYGGFTGCDAAWKWSADAKAKITGPADVIAVTLTGGTSLVTNVDITAGDAVKEGGSSIAVLVNGGALAASNGNWSAGAAKAGKDGAPPDMPPTPGQDAPTTGGTQASAACQLPAGVQGGAPGMTSCEDGASSGGEGGKGGDQSVNNGVGESGSDGSPLPDPNPDSYGLGGIGQMDAAGQCKAGQVGKNGAVGGHGAGGADLGMLSEIGITGGDGVDGKAGSRGQGGGGGGGAKNGVFCGVGGMIDGPGSSGGGGGAGGCGGKGGGAGQAGGSSVAIILLDAKLSLQTLTVKSAGAGNGGKGAAGQSGGGGGLGAAGGAASMFSPSIAGCKGGDGGSGGPGGSGGGGRGGYSIGVAQVGPTAELAGGVFELGAAGDGGDGGTGNEATGKGSDGLACKTLDFVKGADSCVP
jgi:hypothetical protein